MVLLGLTWLFGIIAIGDAKLAFQYLFCIFNTLQGLFVFILFCILPTETIKQDDNCEIFLEKRATETLRSNLAPSSNASPAVNTTEFKFRATMVFVLNAMICKRPTTDLKLSDVMFLNPYVTCYSVR